jgi:hypothetical protein
VLAVAGGRSASGNSSTQKPKAEDAGRIGQYFPRGNPILGIRVRF